MNIFGSDFILEEPFSSIAKNMLDELGADQIKKLPFEVVRKVMTHQDETHFISDVFPGIVLENITGSYTIYDQDRSFLCRVNLHQGVFGNTIPERNYILLMNQYDVIYVSYVDLTGNLRDIQLIKR